MAEVPLRVIKLGGSLLNVPGVADLFRRWLGTQPPADNLLIVGGGAFADAIREADRLHALGEVKSHWLCIRAMSLTAHLVAAMMPELELVDTLGDAELGVASRLRILDPWPLMKTCEGQAATCPLPHSWDVTSDSIAAWLASALGVDELVLLKSTQWKPGADRHTAAADGLIDRYFPRAASQVARIRWVNLRQPTFTEQRV